MIGVEQNPVTRPIIAINWRQRSRRGRAIGRGSARLRPIRGEPCCDIRTHFIIADDSYGRTPKLVRAAPLGPIWANLPQGWSLLTNSIVVVTPTEAKARTRANANQSASAPSRGAPRIAMRSPLSGPVVSGFGGGPRRARVGDIHPARPIPV